MPAEAAAPRGIPGRALELAERAATAISVVADRPRILLAGLVAAQWLAILAFALTVRHNGWIFYQGGDQIWYATTAWELGHGDMPATRVGYGWPLLLAPIALLFGPDFVPMLPAVILLDVLVLGPLALLFVYGIANRLAGRLFALWASVLWVVAPYLTIELWREDYHERFVDQFLPQALGLGGLADFPSMVLLLGSAYFAVRALQEPGWHDAAIAGLLAGMAVGTKPANALFLVGPVVAFALAKRARAMVLFLVPLLPTLVSVALWKQRGLGDLPLFAFEETRVAASSTLMAINVDRYLDLDFDVLRQTHAELREWFWSERLLEWLPIAGTVAVARRSLPIAALLGSWFLVFLVLKGTAEQTTVSSGSFFRLLMPAYPAYFLLAVSLPLLVPGLARRMWERFPRVPDPRFGRRTVVGIAIAFAALPLAVTAFAQPSLGPEETVLVDGILVPVEGFELAVRADGDARELSWDVPAGGPAVFYRVFRSTNDGADVSCEGDGTPECELEMVTLGTTRDGRWRDPRPPADATYRVGRGANWKDDPAAGDVYLISPPAGSP
jgi:hypothetical protein